MSTFQERKAKRTQYFYDHVYKTNWLFVQRVADLDGMIVADLMVIRSLVVVVMEKVRRDNDELF